jgi:hypothetical protein
MPTDYCLSLCPCETGSEGVHHGVRGGVQGGSIRGAVLGRAAGFVFHYPAQVPRRSGDPDCRELQAEGSSSVSDSSGVDGEGVMDYPSSYIASAAQGRLLR